MILISERPAEVDDRVVPGHWEGHLVVGTDARSAIGTLVDPHKPRQRGSSENTTGLLRQYFRKSTDLSVHSPTRLLEMAAELNRRARRTIWSVPHG